MIRLAMYGVENEKVGFNPYCLLCPYTQIKNKENNNGLIKKEYTFLPDFGTGKLVAYWFDGLVVCMVDACLKRDLKSACHVTSPRLDLSYLIEGEQIIEVGEKQVLVFESQESYMVYLTNTKATIQYNCNKCFREVRIRISPDFVKHYRLQELYPPGKGIMIEDLHPNSTKPLCPKTRNILAEMIQDKQHGLIKRLFLKSKVLELLTLQLCTLKDAPQANALSKKLYEVAALIEKDVTKIFTIKELSKQVGINDYTLKKEFKRLFGTTINEYSTDLKMKKAKTLLTMSNKTITEISELIGYKNPTHFTAAFKRVVGVTPKVYRNA